MIKASQAGTALRAGLTNLVNPSKEMAKVMNKYGISLKNSNGEMKSFKEVIVELREKFGKLDKSTQAAAVSTLFGKILCHLIQKCILNNRANSVKTKLINGYYRKCVIINI